MGGLVPNIKEFSNLMETMLGLIDERSDIYSFISDMYQEYHDELISRPNFPFNPPSSGAPVTRPANYVATGKSGACSHHRKYKCSICHQIGHNKQKCPLNKSTVL